LTHPQTHPKEPSGVTFLHLVLVLVGITVVASIGIPLWFAQPRITLQSAAELLVQDMDAVEEHAVLSHTACRIDFDADGGGYSAVTVLGDALPAPMGEGPYRRDYDSDAVFAGVHIEAVDFGKEPTLIFDRFGNAKSEGTVVLQYRGATRIVTFAAGSARITGE